MQTGWVHAIALHSRSGVTNTFQIHPLQLLKFLGGQFGVVSPLFMAGIFVAAVALVWKRHTDLRMRFLLSQFLPLYGLFMFFSLNSAGKENWAAPALVTGIIFTVVYWREIVARHPAWRWGVGAAFAIALLMTVVMHDTDPLMVGLNRITTQFHWRPVTDPLRRAQGWKDFADACAAGPREISRKPADREPLFAGEHDGVLSARPADHLFAASTIWRFAIHALARL